MVLRNVVLTLTLAVLAKGQRGSFAGTRPIGYPVIISPSPAPVATSDLANKFGEDDVSTTTIRLPLEALGDRDLIDRISKLPVDQQPFWYLNWQALEANRKNPQTFEQRPSQFAQPLHPNPSTSNSNTQSLGTRVQINTNSGSSALNVPTATTTSSNFNSLNSNPVPIGAFVNNRPVNAPSTANTNGNRVTLSNNVQPDFQSIPQPPQRVPSLNVRPTNTPVNSNQVLNSPSVAQNQNAAPVHSQTSDPNKGLPSSVELASILGNRYGDEDIYRPSSTGPKNPEHGLQNSHHLDKVVFEDAEDVGFYGPGPEEYDDRYLRTLRQIDEDYFFKY